MTYNEAQQRRREALERHERDLAERDRLDRLTLRWCIVAMAACIALAYFWPVIKSFFS